MHSASLPAKGFGFGPKYHLWQLVARIDLVLGAFAVTALATRSALITLHTMLGLVDGKNRRSPILVVAHGALLVAFERLVNLRQGEPWPEKHRNDYADQKEPGSFAHLFLSYRTEVDASTFDPTTRALLRNGQVHDSVELWSQSPPIQPQNAIPIPKRLRRQFVSPGRRILFHLHCVFAIDGYCSRPYYLWVECSAVRAKEAKSVALSESFIEAPMDLPTCQRLIATPLPP